MQPHRRSQFWAYAAGAVEAFGMLALFLVAILLISVTP